MSKKKISLLLQSSFTRRQMFLGAAGMLAAAAAGTEYDTLALDITRHRVQVPGISRPLRIAQLSDMHRSWCVSERFLHRTAAAANSTKPDVVLLTGDFITLYSSYIHSCLHALKSLRAPLGIYAVLGNHDYLSDMWQGAPRISRALEEAGIPVLVNQSLELRNGLKLVGVDDFATGSPDVRKAFQNVKPADPVICMTHNPLEFDVLCGYSCLTIAGHTHGGQIDIPPLVDMLFRRKARYLRGWFHNPDYPGHLYVSRGLGTLTIPVRINAFPEISVFDLVPA